MAEYESIGERNGRDGKGSSEVGSTRDFPKGEDQKERRKGEAVTGSGKSQGKKAWMGCFSLSPLDSHPFHSPHWLPLGGIHLGFKDDPQSGRSGVPRVMQPVLTCLLGCCHASFIGGL